MSWSQRRRFQDHWHRQIECADWWCSCRVCYHGGCRTCWGSWRRDRQRLGWRRDHLWLRSPRWWPWSLRGTPWIRRWLQACRDRQEQEDRAWARPPRSLQRGRTKSPSVSGRPQQLVHALDHARQIAQSCGHWETMQLSERCSRTASGRPLNRAQPLLIPRKPAQRAPGPHRLITMHRATAERRVDTWRPSCSRRRSRVPHV